MSKLSKAVKVLRTDTTVTNFMGGTNYKLNPLETLKMITASSILGEPSYYREKRDWRKPYVDSAEIKRIIGNGLVIPYADVNKSTTQIATEAIDASLSYDFEGTLQWAAHLRTVFFMRLNPQIIMVRAALHPHRKKFTEANPGKFNYYNLKVMSRADEPLTQMAYFLYLNGGKKNNIPTILKKSWANKISQLTKYEISKYKNSEIGLINGVRLSHANSKDLNELMQTGTIVVDEEQKTWENLKSEGKSWEEIFPVINMGHMALLRNVRGVFNEVTDNKVFLEEYLSKLERTVKGGKQFPFRYLNALEAVEDSNCKHKALAMDSIKKCMDISLENMPKLKGRTMCLSDNSGSAWGCINSEYGTVTVAEIDNLSSVIAGRLSEEGYIGKFGNKLKVYPVSNNDSILTQAQKINEGRGEDVGTSTEGGIWEFFRDAINSKEHWDNIFIFSDMQAGTGGLYGTIKQENEYKKNYGIGSHIDVYKLILEYRKKVNPKVNVFSVQTAGYDNNVVPLLSYRTAILTGWTGKEVSFAAEYIKQWDEIEEKKDNE